MRGIGHSLGNNAVNFQRTKDYAMVRQIFTAPDVYEHLVDDYAPHSSDFAVNAHPDIWYVIACHSGGLVGLFSLIPKNRACFELHACMLPDACAHEKWEAARGLAPWIGERTDCRRLIAEVPRSNRPAIVYGVHGIGMKYVGTHPKAFMKYGKLQDLIILGMPINGG